MAFNSQANDERFTHYCATNSKGHFVIRRKTMVQRMRATLHAIKAKLRRLLHHLPGKAGLSGIHGDRLDRLRQRNSCVTGDDSPQHICIGVVSIWLREGMSKID
jgi:hypothetical protein